MPLRHSRASRLAAEEKKLKDQRPDAHNRARVNSQTEIDALADLIIQRERGRRPVTARSAWSSSTYTTVKRSA
jgi:hypothetical protein